MLVIGNMLMARNTAKKVTIYSAPICPIYKRAKEHLTKREIPFPVY